MLSQVKPAPSPAKIQEIIDTLTERTFIHGHSIGRHEAMQIGLQVENIESELERLCWDLFLQYEKDLKLNSFEDPLAYFDKDAQDKYIEENTVIAYIESADRCHEYSGPLSLQKIRRIPPQLNLNVNVPIQFPSNIQPPDISTHIQQMLEQMQQNLVYYMQIMSASHLRPPPSTLGCFS